MMSVALVVTATEGDGLCGAGVHFSWFLKCVPYLSRRTRRWLARQPKGVFIIDFDDYEDFEQAWLSKDFDVSVRLENSDMYSDFMGAALSTNKTSRSDNVVCRYDEKGFIHLDVVNM